MRKRKLPACCTPRTNCTFTLAPGASVPPGSATVSEELRPPPAGCVGGCSSVVPLTVTAWPLTVTVISEDESARRSAAKPSRSKEAQSGDGHAGRVLELAPDGE